jgi:peptidoglycan/xylan/chitin deacetylase (PgdA/CDA1 family)
LLRRWFEFIEKGMSTALGSLKTAVKALVATNPGFALSRRAHTTGCAVLIYHRVGLPSDPFPNLDVENFKAQMTWLTQNCNVIAPEELRARAAWGAPSRPNVLVTFDDGYRDYFDHAFPVLQRYRIRALNFLCTRFNDDADLMGWWDRLYLAVRRTSKSRARLPWADCLFTLDDAGRAALLRAAKDHIKLQPECHKEDLTQSVLDALGVDGDTLSAPRQAMSWDEVRAASEFTAYGGHTHNHLIVSRLEEQVLETEVQMCRDRIAAETGSIPDTFAYPNGRAIDFTDQSKVTLRRHGFSTAFSAIEGVNGADTDWMAVRRISGGSSVEDLAWRLSRVWH